MKFLNFLLILGLAFSQLAVANSLKENPSPYLALHGNDPVDWQEWGTAPLEQARKEDKLIFVSVGYFACHWCHVMQRESFSDPAVAKVLNEHFVSIKVDRELNPVLDQRLMTFLQATSGRGGWPMNVFLTPDGHPLVGIVYRPKDSFLQLLDSLQERWKSDRAGLQLAAEEVDQLLAESQIDGQQPVAGKKVADLADRYRKDVMDLGDHLEGGFKGQTRFPYAPQLQALLDMNHRTPHDGELEFLRLTLDQMLGKGLRDHVGGGFFRYTVDPGWETPHYEKMLYTNAMLARLLFDAAATLNRPEYQDVAVETLRFMDREMSAQGGAFVASLSAVDDQNIEGGYYHWTQDELKRILTESELDFVNVAWGMLRQDGDDGLLPIKVRNNAALREDFGLNENALEKRVEAIRGKLLAYREKHRVQPRDTKRLTGWNGLALSALARGMEQTRLFKKRGNALAEFLADTVWDGTQLQKAVDSKNQGLGKAALEDYAYASKGLLDWGLATGNSHFVTVGQAMVNSAWEKFFTAKGWLEKEGVLLPSVVYQRHIRDQTLYSPEAVLLRSTLLLATREKGTEVAQMPDVESLLLVVTKSMLNDVFSYPSLINVADERHGLNKRAKSPL
ncbi:MAG: thioredoxin domain-containing protein [bacterium]